MPFKILVVDDDAATMTLISSILRATGYQVLLAYGGADAIRKAKAQKPDLVLTDLEMPGINGVEIIAALRKDPETEHIPIVAVTSYVWDGIAQSAGRMGCDGYLSKPFLPTQLRDIVRRHLPPAASGRGAP